MGDKELENMKESEETGKIEKVWGTSNWSSIKREQRRGNTCTDTGWD